MRSHGPSARREFDGGVLVLRILEVDSLLLTVGGDDALFRKPVFLVVGIKNGAYEVSGHDIPVAQRDSDLCGAGNFSALVIISILDSRENVKRAYDVALPVVHIPILHRAHPKSKAVDWLSQPTALLM